MEYVFNEAVEHIAHHKGLTDDRCAGQYRRGLIDLIEVSID